MYQKKHYLINIFIEDVAKIMKVFQTEEDHELHECVTCEVVEAITNTFEELFAESNPSFDHIQFLKDCGLE